MEGFYAVYYTGVAGFGHAVLALKDATITGADATGGVYDGNFSTSENGGLEIEVELTVPAGATLVTGQTLSEDFSQKITAKLGADFTNGEPVPVQTPLGPVNAIFKKLRSFS